MTVVASGMDIRRSKRSFVLGKEMYGGPSNCRRERTGVPIPKTRPKPMSKNIDPIVEIGVQFSCIKIDYDATLNFGASS